MGTKLIASCVKNLHAPNRFTMFIAILGFIACAIIAYFLYQFKKELHQLRAPIPKPDKRPLEDNPFGFVPNTDYQQTHFPWRNVIDCMGDKLPAAEFKENEACPRCARPADKLDWIHFSSPKWTWQRRCGRAGPLSICPSCKIQVEFICHMMN